MTPEAAPRPDVVGSPFSTFKRGEGEALLRKRFDAWQYGQQWHEALDDAIATRIEAEAAAGTALVIDDDMRDLFARAMGDHILDPEEGWPHTRMGRGKVHGCDDLCSDYIVTRYARLAVEDSK